MKGGIAREEEMEARRHKDGKRRRRLGQKEGRKAGLSGKRTILRMKRRRRG